MARFSALFCILLVCATFLTTAVWTNEAQAAITVTIQKPTAGAVVGDSLPVTVTVQSTYALSKVHASVDTVSADLAYGSLWSGTLSLAALASGSKTLTVTATDIFSQTGIAQVAFTLDRPPVVTWTLPEPEFVARPNATFQLACIDDGPGGCTKLEVRKDFCSGGALLASGTTSISTTVSLAAYEGSGFRPHACAYDSANQLTETSPYGDNVASPGLYVDSSPTLVEVAFVGGRILDFDANRILWVDPSGALKIRDRATQQDATINGVTMTSPGGMIPVGFLTSYGVIFKAKGVYLYEWSNGQLIDLSNGENKVAHWLQVNGKYAAWGEGFTYYLRDLSTGVTVTATSNGSSPDSAVNTPANWLTSDGALAYSNQQEVFTYKAGTSTKVSANTGYNTSPVYDGIHVVYKKAFGYNQIVMYDGSSESVLSTGPSLLPYAGRDYAVGAGWIAFVRPAAGALQVFRRSPSGVEHQMSVWGTDSQIAGLNSSGDVLVHNGGRRYLTAPGALPTDISTTLGRALYQVGAWHIVIGRSLFQISGMGPPDAGASDASLSDAGLTDVTTGGTGGTGGAGAGAAGIAGSGEFGGTGGAAGSSAGGTGGASGFAGSAAMGSGGIAGPGGGGDAGTGATSGGGANGGSNPVDAGVTDGSLSDAAKKGGGKSGGSASSGCSATHEPKDIELVGVLLAAMAALLLRRRRVEAAACRLNTSAQPFLRSTISRTTHAPTKRSAATSFSADG